MTFQRHVTESHPNDVGRGIARLDPADIRQLNLQIGDVVELCGARQTVARVMPMHAEQRGQQRIQMDGLTRSNAQIGLDEAVTIRATTVNPARRISLTPTQAASRLRLTARPELNRLLDGIPVLTGDTVRVALMGGQAQSFTISQTDPPGAVLITAETTIRLTDPADSPPSTAAITYEDIGGLRRELRRIREMIELPLRHPELFARLGIDPPKGVLLHGPPGCGKTLIARAVAHETSAHFITINGPEVIDKWYGGSESKLRAIFEEARQHAPSIIFIDEIDALAPKREGLSGDRQVERRVVAQLLALLDGLESRGELIVIAATNLPNAVDPALRRPGRFDRELALRIPDQPSRLEILQIHTRGMPLSDGVDLAEVARLTHGFVGADLASLCREAAMSALRRVMPDFDWGAPDLPYDQLTRLTVTPPDFQTAFAEVEPSAMREFFTEIPDVTWADVGGLETVKQHLIEAVTWPLQHAALFAHTGARPPKGILLHGPPGTGKTLLAKALARESEANFIAINGPQLLNQWVGESERGVRDLFRIARQAAPCIIFFDEIDAIATRRGSGDTPVIERIVSQLLTEMDGLELLLGVTIVAATNRLDRLDPALLRPGRFEVIVEVPPPDEATRLAILQVHTQTMPLADGVDLPALAQQTAGLVGAELAGLCRRASLTAMRRFLQTSADASEVQACQIQQTDFL